MQRVTVVRPEGAVKASAFCAQNTRSCRLMVLVLLVAICRRILQLTLMFAHPPNLLHACPWTACRTVQQHQVPALLGQGAGWHPAHPQPLARALTNATTAVLPLSWADCGGQKRQACWWFGRCTRCSDYCRCCQPTAPPPHV